MFGEEVFAGVRLGWSEGEGEVNDEGEERTGFKLPQNCAIAPSIISRTVFGRTVTNKVIFSFTQWHNLQIFT